MTRRPIRLADAGDIPELVQLDHVHFEWPPPGMHVERKWSWAEDDDWIVLAGAAGDGPGSDYLYAEMVGDESGLTNGDWYVTTVGNLLLDGSLIDDWIQDRLQRLLGLALPPTISAVANWPVIYEVGKGLIMRWLKSTIRGTLGTVEQFQFQTCWGVPGNDPQTSEAEALALAESLAGYVKNVLLLGTNAILPLFSNEVKFTEVGVTEETLTQPVNVDGTGGNLEQTYPTQWFAYPVGNQPIGTANNPKTLPYEVACAVTFQTDLRGPRGRGRAYLPCFDSYMMAEGGKWLAGVPLTVGAGFGEYFAAVETAEGLQPVVVSKRGQVLNTVTSVNVGQIPDSQRRRRNAQDEARITGWVRA